MGESWDYEEEAGTGAAAGVGAQVRQGGHNVMLRQPLESSDETEEAEEADEGGDRESAAQLEKGMLLLRQSLETRE